MKKQKRSSESKPAAAAVPLQRQPRAWWPWAVALAALVAVFETYSPALDGAFVLDDRALPFMSPDAARLTFFQWIGGRRPALYFTFWVDYIAKGTEPFLYHATNVLLHFLTSAVVVLILAKLLEWAGVIGRQRAVLAVSGGALFLLHPLQTESVAYVASRSEILSVLLFYGALAVFVYRGQNSMTPLRSLAVIALFAGAILTKEHTLVLPALLLLTDYFWHRGGIRKHTILYGLMALGGSVGAVTVWRVLRGANTAGFGMADLTPRTYLYTQSRVIWTYVRLFFLPYGQNVDPDVPLSTGFLDHGAIFGLAALAIVAIAAWFYRKRWPLASFGVLVFLLLLAPTSSVVPIRDPLAEHRLYLPFIGLALVCLEGLRRMRLKETAWICASVLAVCCVLTYQRNQVWASPLALWQDSASKSPQKRRPNFQHAYALYEENRCVDAAQSYETTSHLGPLTDDLLVDWALALDCANRRKDAIAKLLLATSSQAEASHGGASHGEATPYALLGMMYAKQKQYPEALQALAKAEGINPGFEMTYVYRGNIYALAGDRAAAAREYQRALAVNPTNQAARDALDRVSR